MKYRTSRQSLVRAALAATGVLLVGVAFIHNASVRDETQTRAVAGGLARQIALDLSARVAHWTGIADTLDVWMERHGSDALECGLAPWIAERHGFVRSVRRIEPIEGCRLRGPLAANDGVPVVFVECGGTSLEVSTDTWLERGGIERAEAQGYLYSLHPSESGAAEGFFGAAGPPGADALAVPVRIDGRPWQLSLTPSDGWTPHSQPLAAFTLVLLLASSAGFSVWGVLRQPERLRAEAEARKRRLRKARLELAQARKRAETARVRDELTGFPNRAAFVDKLRTALEIAAERDSHAVAVLLLDLDGFARIHSSMGADFGDRLIVAVADRLKENLRAEHAVSRLGSDEFALMIQDPRGNDVLRRFADGLRKHLTEPYRIDGEEYTIGVSIGSALGNASDDGATDELDSEPTALIRDAGMAMRQARSLGGNNYVPFDASMRTREIGELQLERDLRKAIANGELRNFYQPIRDLTVNRISGFESLIRWEHPERGLLPPAAFLPIAEKSSLILDIDRWSARESCRQLRAWHEQYVLDPPLTMNVNLSGREFSQPDLVQFVQETLEETGVHPAAVNLEVTESVMMEDPDRAIALLNDLKQLGVGLSLDDFGTGYSSLGYLNRFPLDAVKIDRSFVWAMNASEKNLEIVRTVIELAAKLGMKVVAEGIETDEHLQQLVELRCPFGQGYLFAKPEPATEAELRLTERLQRETG